MEQVYRLVLEGPLHVGELGIGREETLAYVPADTLFAALVDVWARTQPGGVEEWLAPFATDPPTPPWLLTSAFPYAGDVRLFPTPAFEPPLAHREKWRAWGKKAKKVGHVSEGIFRAWLDGRPVDEWLADDNLIQGRRVWVTPDERRQVAVTLQKPADEPQALRLWATAIAPRVTVDRATNRSNLFHTGRVTFARGCGLWFAVRFAPPPPTPQAGMTVIETGLDLLADEGMGGLRSTGHGAFRWERWAGAAPLPPPDGGGPALTLSRVAPRRAEVSVLRAEGAAYRLVTVGGWCGGLGEPPRKRRQVRLVAEGSVVGWEGGPLGQLVDVRPTDDSIGHPVYRYGLAYPLAVAAGAGQGKERG